MFLNEILGESADGGSVGADSIAGSRGTLFSGGVITPADIERVMPNPVKVQKLKLNFSKKRINNNIPIVQFGGEE